MRDTKHSLHRITKHPPVIHILHTRGPVQAEQLRALNLVIPATPSPMSKKGFRSQLVIIESYPSPPEPPWKDPQDILKQGSNKRIKDRGRRDLNCLCIHRLQHEVRMGCSFLVPLLGHRPWQASRVGEDGSVAQPAMQ